MKTLIVNADDFGHDPAINAAVEQAHEQGILTSASLMVRSPHAGEAVRIARRQPALGLGLHLCLIAGDLPPDEGETTALPGSPLGLCLALARDRGALRQRIDAEIRGQIRAFLDTGLRPTHLDTHRHLHIHPAVFDSVLAAAREFGVSVVRLPMEPLRPALRAQRGRAALRTARWRVFRAFVTRNRHALARSGIRSAGRSVGVLNPGHVTEEFLCRYLPRLPAGATEIFCHPATGPVEGQKDYENAHELAALCSPRVRDTLKAQGITLASFAALHEKAPDAVEGIGG